MLKSMVAQPAKKPRTLQLGKCLTRKAGKPICGVTSFKVLRHGTQAPCKTTPYCAFAGKRDGVAVFAALTRNPDSDAHKYVFFEKGKSRYLVVFPETLVNEKRDVIDPCFQHERMLFYAADAVRANSGDFDASGGRLHLKSDGSGFLVLGRSDLGQGPHKLVKGILDGIYSALNGEMEKVRAFLEGGAE